MKKSLALPTIFALGQLSAISLAFAAPENKSLNAAMQSAEQTYTDTARTKFIKVPFITSRRIDQRAVANARLNQANLLYEAVFLNELSPSVSYGIVTISYPIKRKVAEDNFAANTASENPFYHFSMWDYQLASDPEALKRTAAEYYSNPNPNKVFLYVHGMDNSFSEATERAAQLTLDIGEPVLPIAFSWPSDIARTNRDQALRVPFFTEYFKVLSAANSSVKFLSHSLTVARSMTPNVYLLAHSMGAAVSIRALEAVSSKSKLIDSGNSKFNLSALVFAAPDVSLKTFQTENLRNLQSISRKISVYCADDRALYFSELANGNDPRLGRCGREPPKVPGVQVIQVTGKISDTMRHSYFLTGKKVIQSFRAEMYDENTADKAGIGANIKLKYIDLDR